MARKRSSPVEREALVAENERLRAFRAQIEKAHDAHLQTGGYVPLGMAAQDALLFLRRAEKEPDA